MIIFKSINDYSSMDPRQQLQFKGKFLAFLGTADKWILSSFIVYSERPLGCIPSQAIFIGQTF